MYSNTHIRKVRVPDGNYCFHRSETCRPALQEVGSVQSSAGKSQLGVRLVLPVSGRQPNPKVIRDHIRSLEVTGDQIGSSEDIDPRNGSYVLTNKQQPCKANLRAPSDQTTEQTAVTRKLLPIGGPLFWKNVIKKEEPTEGQRECSSTHNKQKEKSHWQLGENRPRHPKRYGSVKKNRRDLARFHIGLARTGEKMTSTGPFRKKPGVYCHHQCIVDQTKSSDQSPE